MTDHTPRALCPGCAKTYGAVVNPECPICRGLGVLPLGAPALHYHAPGVVARAVELRIVAAAHQAITELPIIDRAEHLTTAVDELRLAGLIATPEQATNPVVDYTPVPTREAETAAHGILETLGTEIPTAALALHHAPRRPLTRARTRHGDPFPVLSGDGWPDPVAQVADPVDALGPSGQHLEHARRAAEHEADVLARATPAAAARRSKTRRTP